MMVKIVNSVAIGIIIAAVVAGAYNAAIVLVLALFLSMAVWHFGEKVYKWITNHYQN